MAEKLLDCVVISSDPALVAKAAKLMADGQRGLKLAAQYTSLIAEIGKAQAEEIRQSGAQVLLLDMGDDPAVGLRLARFLAEDNPMRTFVLTGPAVSPEVLLEAMRVGASEYLPRPVDEADLAAALARATRRMGGVETRDVQQQGKVTAVYGAKGGSGVTTAAANLAVTIAQKTHKATLLIDLDLDMGGSALLLGLRPRYSVLDVVRNLHRLDRDLLDSYIEVHESGVSVLASPAQPMAADPLTREQTRAMLQVAKRHYEHVVVDLDQTLSPVTLAGAEGADTVLVLTTPDVAALNNTKRALPAIDRAVGDLKRVRIVLNRRRPDDVITPAEVKKALGRDVFSSLVQEERALAESLNTGKPVVLRRKSKYARSLKQLADQLLGTHSTNGRAARSKGGSRGFFSRMRRTGED